MDKKYELARIFTGTEILCLALKGELERIDVIGMIKNEFQSSISTGFAIGSPSTIDLYIYEYELEKAMPVIENFTKNNPQ